MLGAVSVQDGGHVVTKLLHGLQIQVAFTHGSQPHDLSLKEPGKSPAVHGLNQLTFHPGLLNQVCNGVLNGSKNAVGLLGPSTIES